MKKVWTACLVVLMVVCMSVTAFAASDGFVSSPSGNKAPVEENFDPDDDDCTATMVITPYVAKDTLDPDKEGLMEDAYNDIVENADDLTQLNADFAAYVATTGIDPENLAIADLFDISCEDCAGHADHHGFSIKISAETLSRFVGLLHMPEKDVWEYVDNATVSADGSSLEFYVDSLSPFAIVVDTTAISPEPTPEPTPATGDHSNITLWVVVLAVSAVAVTGILVYSKKRKAA